MHTQIRYTSNLKRLESISLFICITVDWLWMHSIYLECKIEYVWNATFISFMWEKIEFKFNSGQNGFLGFQNLILKLDFFLYQGFAAAVYSA